MKDEEAVPWSKLVEGEVIVGEKEQDYHAIVMIIKLCFQIPMKHG